MVCDIPCVWPVGWRHSDFLALAWDTSCFNNVAPDWSNGLCVDPVGDIRLRHA